MKKILFMVLVIGAMLLLVGCGGGSSDDGSGEVKVVDGIDVSQLTQKTDIWIVKNVNQAGIDEITRYAKAQLDPDAVILVENLSCNQLGRYALLETKYLFGGAIDSGTGAFRYYYQNSGLSDNEFYCKEYSLPSNATIYENNISGNLTVAIGGWNNNLDQSLHNSYFGRDTTEFTTAMIAGQTFYEWNDANNDGIATRDEWLRATFESNGNLLFERNGTSEIAGTYTVVDGEIIATTVDGDLTITLNEARATEWDVKFVEDNESTTWFRELKYTLDMLVGKKFSLELPEGTMILEIGETTAKIYNVDGVLLGEEAYAIENGVLIGDSEGARNRRYLIKLESDGSLLSWNAEDPEANVFTFIQ